MRYFDSSNICIATLSKVYSDIFTEGLKERVDVILVEITEKNRKEKEQYIEDLLQKMIN